MSIQAQWIGGPWDGRWDALPECREVSIAVPLEHGCDELIGPWARNYVELRLPVERQWDGTYLIRWHEPW